MTKIKICGITNIKDAMAAAELGVDAMGFIFAESPRRIDPLVVRNITRQLPPFVSRVGVFVNEKPDIIRSTARYCSLSIAQLHGGESRAYLESLDFPALKVFRVRDKSILEEIEKFSCAYFLLDTQAENRHGGTGKTFDWQIAKSAKALGNVIIGGGLNSDNIIDALETVCPYGIDVSSGVEAAPGRKDIGKLETFVRRVKSWDNRTS